ncbi:MAG: thioredoxin family protein [Saprospiraceae bacterium]
MRYLVLSLLLCISSAMVGSVNKYEPSYHKGTLESAKSLAKSENKYVFVKFYADWCVPCKWMDETTYSDPTVVGKINANFIPLKVNIDDFDGFSLRQELAVSVLPTVIIFDSDGRVIKRIEETLPPSKMIKIIDKVVVSNGNMVIHNVNQSPSHKRKISSNTSSNDYKTKSYKLQLGVFEGFENTMNFLDDVKEKLNEQAMVLHDYQNGKTMYKVLIGRYKTHSKAVAAQHQLKINHGIDSVVY